MREQNYLADCQAIADAKPLKELEYQQLKKRLVKNSHERQRLRRYELAQRYGIPVTADLVQKDDQNWYQKLRWHYFLTVGGHSLAIGMPKLPVYYWIKDKAVSFSQTLMVPNWGPSSVPTTLLAFPFFWPIPNGSCVPWMRT
ncbi:hypothetical protein NON20_07340 [Synechocystis sp. B12]|nr:hypothetical protein NON20_07340 [Synechocystis sp. B12]